MKKIPHLAYLTATCSWIGLLPAPGTMATLFAAATHYLLRAAWGVPLSQLHLLHLLFVFSGLWSSAVVSRALGDKDPAQVVIDEWAAMWLLACMLPLNRSVYIAALILFRLFDIAKPWPVCWAERLPGAWGILADDYCAAVCAGSMLLLLSNTVL